MELTGKRIILTGAASGIGLALLKLLIQFECKIVVTDIQREQLEKSIQELPVHSSTVFKFIGDISKQETVDELFTFAQTQMEGIDIFIANAGFAYYESLNKADWQRLEKIYQVNVFSPIYSTVKMQELHPVESYTVVLVASAMSYIAIPGYSIYASTKAAIDRFAEGYYFDKPTNAHIMVVYPISTRTKFFNSSGKDVPVAIPSQTPEWVAQKILKGLQNDSKKVFTSYSFRWLRFSAIGLQLMRLIGQLIGNIQLSNWKKKQQK
jgi:uncharacterized protein